MPNWTDSYGRTANYDQSLIDAMAANGMNPNGTQKAAVSSGTGIEGAYAQIPTSGPYLDALNQQLTAMGFSGGAAANHAQAVNLWNTMTGNNAQNATNVDTSNAAYTAAAEAKSKGSFLNKYFLPAVDTIANAGVLSGIGSAYSPTISGLTGYSPAGSNGLTGMSAGSPYLSAAGDASTAGQVAYGAPAGDAGYLGAGGGAAGYGGTAIDAGGLAGGTYGAVNALTGADLAGTSIGARGVMTAGNALGDGTATSLLGAGGALGGISSLATGVGGLGSLAAGVGALTGQGLTGGGKTASTQSGWDAIPGFDQSALTGLVNSGNSLLSGAGGAAMYTPMPLTPDEQTADRLSQPMTQQGVTDLTNNYMNPFNDFLMKNIQNTAQGINSNYQGQVSGSGFAPGTTNRDFLNTAYNQGQEDLAIGTTSAGEYNTALTTGLGQQNTNVSQLMGMGANQRAIDLQTRQAPISALNALGQLTGYIPNSSQGQSQETPNQLDNLGNLLNMGKTGLSGLSNYFNNPRGSTSGTSSFFG